MLFVFNLLKKKIYMHEQHPYLERKTSMQHIYGYCLLRNNFNIEGM